MITAIIQARTNSTRLPQKILLEVLEKTLLELMIERIRNSKSLEKIVIATTVNPIDDVIEDLCKKLQIECYRGSEDDVLSRYVMVGEKTKSDIIVRLNSDCPLIDPCIIDEVITFYLNNNYDYVSNVFPKFGSFPEGMGVEIFSHGLLKTISIKAKKPSQREHPTSFIWTQPTKFKIFRIECKKNLKKYRLSLDYEEDFQLIKSVFNGLYDRNKKFGLDEIIDWLDKNPKVFHLNSHITKDEGWLLSLEKDKSAGF